MKKDEKTLSQKPQRERLDPLTILPDPIKIQIYDQFLTGSDLGHALAVSSSWREFYSDRLLWRKKLEQDFGLPKELLNYIRGLDHPRAEFLCYRSLANLTRNLSSNFMAPILKTALDSSETDPFLLVKCLLDDTSLFTSMPKGELYNWFIISCFAGGINIPTSFLKVLPINPKMLAEIVAYSGNLEVMKYSLDPDSKLGHSVTEYTLAYAVRSGNLRLAEFLRTMVNIKKNEYYLRDAVLSNSSEMVEYAYTYLLPPKDQLQDLFLSFLKELLNLAAKMGNSKIINFFLERNFKLKLSVHSLNKVAESGNFLLLKKLLNNVTFGLKPSITTLNAAAASGNTIMLDYLLDPNNNFSLHPTEETLNASTAAPNDRSFNYLINPEKSFGFKSNLELLNSAVRNSNVMITRRLLTDPKLAITPDQSTLLAAAEGGSLSIVRLLVEKFGLIPDEDTLSKGIRSQRLGLVKYLTNPSGLNIPVSPFNIQFAETLYCNNWILRYVLDSVENYANARAKSELTLSVSLFNEGMTALGRNEPYQKSFEEARQSDPIHFFLTLDYFLHNCQKEIFKKLAELAIVQNTPFPSTQLLLANAGREGLIDLSSDQITQLYQKALAGFQVLSWDSQAAEVEAYLSSQPKQP